MQNKLSLPPTGSLGYQIRRCHRLIDRMLTLRLDHHGLNSGFWYYLRVLWIRDGRTQKELSDETHVTENTTAAVINMMIRRGLVERARDPVDRRKLRITLTPLGRKLQAELMPYAFEINAIAATDISREELETCLSVLARVAQNVQRALVARPGEPEVTSVVTKPRRKAGRGRRTSRSI